MLTLRSIVLILAASAALAMPARAEDAPVFDFQTVMDMYFDDTSGLISFGDYTVAFAPPESFDGLVAVVDASGTVVAQHKFFTDYTNREGVFARVRAEGPADVTLNKPGLYTIVFVVDGKPVTRFAVRLVQASAGDDPFDPEKTFRFDGYWRTLAYFTSGSYKGEAIPVLSLWVGGMDLVDDKRDGFTVELMRGDELIAHSKPSVSTIQAGHFRRTSVNLYHPHTDKEAPNAQYLTMQELLVDGNYQVRVKRHSDGQLLRTYDFEVADGKLVGLDRSARGYEPAPDYIMPRVLKKGTTGLEMVEATWIQHREPTGQ